MVSNNLPESITRASSKQTYYTIRLFVDSDRKLDAYRAYAYFRWFDDQLDEHLSSKADRLAFVERQYALLRGECPPELTPEEYLLLDLIHHDHNPDGGLHTYIQNMMAVMAFDAQRRGLLISQQELDDYTLHLATAVTEALHYFIGSEQFSPHNETRYLAVSAAHITHMLRDTVEDIAAGYFNIPIEFLETRGISPRDVQNAAYQEWVKSRVRLAREYFRIGKTYLSQIENHRCRLAGYAYIARFEWVLNVIERENYQLRPDYSERKSLKAGISIGLSALRFMFANNNVVPTVTLKRGLS